MLRRIQQYWLDWSHTSENQIPLPMPIDVKERDEDVSYFDPLFQYTGQQQDFLKGQLLIL